MPGMPGPVRKVHRAHYLLRGSCYFLFPWVTGIPSCGDALWLGHGPNVPCMGPAQRLRSGEDLLFIPWRTMTAFLVLFEPAASAPASP